MESKNNVDQSSPSQLMVDDDGGCLCPVTPYSNQESVNSTSKCISPSTLVSPPMNKMLSLDGPSTPMEDVFGPLARDTENLILSSPSTLVSPPMNKMLSLDGPSTPMEDVFGPLARDTENLILSSKGLNNVENSRSYVARRLNFSSKGVAYECASESKVEGGSLMETVYESILEGIISKQAEDILAEIVASDVLMTPKNEARISGIAYRCPGAPMKRVGVRKFRDVAASSCRKLEF